jgi:IS605 OrfB family transposase
MEKYIRYHNPDGTLNELGYKFSEENDCASFPKYKKKKSLMPLITDQIRPIWYKGKKCIKLPLSNLTRTSKVFKQIFEDKLIDTFIKESELKESFNIFFKIPKELYDKKIRQFRVIPNSKGDDFHIEFTYEINIEKPHKEIKKSLSIDLGISNLASCVTTDNISFIIDGKYLKSLNRLYNKKKANLQSLLPKGIYSSKRLRNLDIKRNNQIEDYLNKAVSTLIKKCLKLNVDEIIIGYNKGIKKGGIKNTKLKGKKKKKTNQSFVQIPISRFKDKIIMKTKEYGIYVRVINESYTSKSSFYDNDPIIKGQYSGERIRRSLYKTKDGLIVNADINAALNIYKKYVIKSNLKNNLCDYLMSRGLTIPSRVIVAL